jgi:hypothetical protein
MDCCCQSLGELEEYETDRLIPYFVRSQELSRRVADAFSFDDINNGGIRGEFHINLIADTFTRELDRLQMEFPRDLWKNCEKASPNDTDQRMVC